MNAVFLDTAPLIYLVEGTPALREASRSRIAAWIESGTPLRSSVLTLAELLVPAKRSGNADLIFRYKSTLATLLGHPLQVLDENQAEWAAEIRARYSFAMPDSMQLASSLAMGCDIFYTNDRALRAFKELDIVLVED